MDNNGDDFAVSRVAWRNILINGDILYYLTYRGDSCLALHAHFCSPKGYIETLLADSF